MAIQHKEPHGNSRLLLGQVMGLLVALYAPTVAWTNMVLPEPGDRSV